MSSKVGSRELDARQYKRVEILTVTSAEGRSPFLSNARLTTQTV